VLLFSEQPRFGELNFSVV